MADGDDHLQRKQQLYADLDALNNDDDTPDAGRQASRQMWKQKSSSVHPAPIARAEAARSSLVRSASDSRVEVSTRPDTLDPYAKPSSTDPVGPGRLLVKSASDFAASSIATRTTSKRKREVPVRTVSEEQQIFQGLRFYFFPNNDDNPARRMRISKAQQFGAIWEREWSENVTHIIPDKSIGYQQILKFLRLDKMPDSVIVVSENYPAECLSYRTVLEPGQVRFMVKGDAPPAGVRNNGVEVPELDTSNELDEAIQQAKALQHIPLDEDEEDSRPNMSEGLEEGHEEKAALKLLNKQKGKMSNMEDKFQCMHKHTGNKSEANQATIDILQQMASFYDKTGDEWRVRAYRKAITTLRTHPSKVSTKEEASPLPNIGGRIAEKIEEIVVTSRLRRLENAKAEPKDEILQTFMGVYGAGLVQATRWVDQGFKTLDEVLEKAKVSNNQRIGIEHYDDFNSRIPRAEVEQHGNVVRLALQNMDPAFQVIVGGSYRRGAKDSGDVDLIITRPDTGAEHLRTVVMDQLIPSLTKEGFLVANLAITSRDDGSKWHGASRLPDSTTWRRLDLLLVPSEELGAALIYFTGNDIFNRSLRLLASRKGMRLNQRGLYRDVLRGPKRAKLTDGMLVEGKNEKRIFEALGVPWRPPEHRIC